MNAADPRRRAEHDATDPPDERRDRAGAGAPSSPQAIEAELRALVRRVAPGARIYFPRKRGWKVGTQYSWNGRHLRPTGLTLESQLHEIAHLLLAAPHRLDQPEFGLGPDPYRRYDVPRTVCEQQADLEEIHTCWMQLLLTHLFDLDDAAVCYEYQLEPLTGEMIRVLRKTYPDALPEPWWARALELFGAPTGDRDEARRAAGR